MKFLHRIIRGLCLQFTLFGARTRPVPIAYFTRQYCTFNVFLPSGPITVTLDHGNSFIDTKMSLCRAAMNVTQNLILQDCGYYKLMIPNCTIRPIGSTIENVIEYNQ